MNNGAISDRFQRWRVWSRPTVGVDNPRPLAITREPIVRITISLMLEKFLQFGYPLFPIVISFEKSVPEIFKDLRRILHL
jgi:hypothetical protein